MLNKTELIFLPIGIIETNRKRIAKKVNILLNENIKLLSFHPKLGKEFGTENI